MPPSRPELDVCLLGHPRIGEVGGVTRWAQRLARDLGHLRIATLAVRGEPAELPPARIYHALTPDVAALAGPAARRARRPLVLTAHAMDEPWRPEGWRGAVMPDASQGGNGGGNGGGKGGGRWGSARYAVEAIAAVSDAVAQSHVDAGIPAGGMVVIPNGAPAPSPDVSAPAEPLVGFVGRLAPVKGVERLMRAVRAARAEVPDARLVLVGPDDGPPGYGERLRRLARRPGLRGAVTFAGAAGPEAWYPRMACFAMASETEGMPLALLEAMAHGVPCVAPDVGGVREALGDAGLIVPPRDVDALAGAIVRLLSDRDEAARLGRRARQRAGAWTAADGAAAYAALYAAVAR